MKFTLVLKSFLLLLCTWYLSGCMTPSPPRDVNHICHIFQEYPKWYREAKHVERKWQVPVHVQMAIIHQESKFDAVAKPPRTKLLWIIPWKRPSTAYGYSQALDATWKVYQKHQWRWWASRDSFKDAVDFIGWYADQAHIKAGIPKNDPYRLYLAYHEGVGGYMRRSYLSKPWLIQVAHKVSARSAIYRAQLAHCRIAQRYNHRYY